MEKQFTFSDITLSPGNLDLSPDRKTLYYLQKGVRSMDIHASGLPTDKLVEEGQGQFYNLEAMGDQGRIYVTDAKDYVQKGALYIFRKDGTPVDTFETGIIPNDLHFRTE